jgi:hypothetical protein
MVPTEFMAATVAMLAYALAQLLYFGDKFFPRHLVKVGVHNVLPTESIPELVVVRRDRWSQRLKLFFGAATNRAPSGKRSKPLFCNIINQLPKNSSSDEDPCRFWPAPTTILC